LIGRTRPAGEIYLGELILEIPVIGGDVRGIGCAGLGFEIAIGIIRVCELVIVRESVYVIVGVGGGQERGCTIPDGKRINLSPFPLNV